MQNCEDSFKKLKTLYIFHTIKISKYRNVCIHLTSVITLLPGMHHLSYLSSEQVPLVSTIDSLIVLPLIWHASFRFVEGNPLFRISCRVGVRGFILIIKQLLNKHTDCKIKV